MSLLVQFQEFQGISEDEMMIELDKILLVSLHKLRDSSDLRRRVLLYPILDKLIKHRKIEIMADPQENIQPAEDETF